jgi:hypothetical protein
LVILKCQMVRMRTRSERTHYLNPGKTFYPWLGSGKECRKTKLFFMLRK